MKRDTVGKISVELLQKDPETVDPIEQMRVQLSDYEKNLIASVEDGLKKYIGNFYVVVITKRERLMPNVFRHYFAHRLSCPTPDYDQTVYRYHKEDEHLEYMWTLPDRETCILFKINALQVPPEERELLDYILSFYDGSLLKLAKQLNGEREDSLLLA